jgi:Zn-dependent protease
MKWKLGNVEGIGVYIHWTFWLLPAWILLSTLSSGGGVGAAAISLVFVFAIFGCVVLHELGHALMARQYRIGTRDITLYPIGGVASLERMPTRPSAELAIALAGPAVNVVIAAGLFVLLLLSGVTASGMAFNPFGGGLLANLMWVNVVLVIFNLLPAFPMDGGRVLRAFLAMQMPHANATVVAARVGQVMAVLMGLVGLFTGSMLMLVAVFVFLAAQAELTMARRQLAFGGQEPIVAELVPEWVPNRSPQRSYDSGIIWLTEESPAAGQSTATRSYVFRPTYRPWD